MGVRTPSAGVEVARRIGHAPDSDAGAGGGHGHHAGRQGPAFFPSSVWCTLWDVPGGQGVGEWVIPRTGPETRTSTQVENILTVPNQLQLHTGTVLSQR